MKALWVFMLVLTARCVGATYYVALDGQNVAPYDTWEKAATSPATILTHIASYGGPGNAVHIGAGTWDGVGEMAFCHPSHSATTVVGRGRDETVIASAGHTVHGDGVGQVAIRDLTLVADDDGYAVYLQAGCTDWAFVDIDLLSGAAHEKRLVTVEGGAVTFTRCRFLQGGNRVNDYVAYLGGDSTTVFDYCVFCPAVHGFCLGSILCSGMQADFINCNALGFESVAVIAHTGVTGMVNSIVAAVGIRNNAAGAVRQDAAGVLSVCNSLLMGNMWDGDADPTGGPIAVDLGNIKDSGYPLFRRRARQGYLLPCVDDSCNFRYAQALAALLAEYDMRGTYYLTQSSWSSVDTAAVRSMVADGIMEVGCHTYSHSPLLCTNALSIQYTGRDTNPTVELTATGVLRLRTAEGADDRDIDTTDPRRDTIGEIVTLSGAGGWTIAKAATDGLYVRDACLASSMGTQPRIAAPAVIPLDTSGYAVGFLKNEITDPKVWMAQVLVNGDGDILDGQTDKPYVCQTFAPAFGPQTSASRQACIDAGYLLSRGRPPADLHRHAPKCGVTLVDADLYSMRFFWGYGCLDGSEAQVRSSARALAYAVVEAGLAVPVLAHNSEEMTLEKWRWCLDEWSKFGEDLVVTSHQLFAEVVRDPDGPWVPRGDGTYSRTYTQYTDYHPIPGSPCIDAGLDMGREYALDFEGRDQDSGGSWDIGAYVYGEATGLHGDR